MRSNDDVPEGWRGWDEYAEFYDWENAKTMGRRDVRFWQAFVRDSTSPVLELGCGTGRVTIPLARTAAHVVGIDRSSTMLDRARPRLRRSPGRPGVTLTRGDIAHLPFPASTFAHVVAPYGILQSLLSEKMLTATLEGVASVLRRRGRFGMELVPDVPRWKETSRRLSLVDLRGPNGRPVRLYESVHQDRARRLTVFDQEFVEGTGRSRRTLRFSIAFRSVRIPAMLARLQGVGLEIEHVFGGYRGEPWSEDADTWIILSRKR